MSFYEWLQRYPHEMSERRNLAKELKKMSRKTPQIKRIDSFDDLVAVGESIIQDNSLRDECTGSLWAEYCAICNHP